MPHRLQGQSPARPATGRSRSMWLVLLAALAAAAVVTGCELPPPVTPGDPEAPASPTAYSLMGPVASIAEYSGNYVFAGPAANVVVTETTPRVTGVASMSIGYLHTGDAGFVDVGMCWKQGNGAVTNFAGAGYVTVRLTDQRDAVSASATVVLAPGTYSVGMCVRNNSAYRISNSSYVNGWVQVTA